MQTATESLLAKVKSGIAEIKDRRDRPGATFGERSGGDGAVQVIPAPGMVGRPPTEGPREVPLRDGAAPGEEASVSTAPEAGVKPDARKSANTRGLDGRPPGGSGPKNK